MRISMLLVAFILFAGCTPLPPAKTKAYRVEPQLNPVKVVRSWQTEPAAMETFGTTRQEFAGALHVGSNDQIVVGDSTGRVVAYRAANGKKLWETRVPGAVHARPAYGEGAIYVPLLDGGVVALDGSDGSELWTATTDNSLETTPLSVDGRVFAVDSGDVLHAIDAATGEELWRHEREFPGYFTIKGAATPIEVDGELLAGFSDGHLVTFVVETGEIIWDTDLTSGVTQFVDVDAPIIVEGDTIYAASYAGGLHALDRVSGEVSWTRDFKSIGWVHPMSDQLVVASATGRVIAVARDGEGVWAFRTSKAVPTSITTYGEYVVVSTAQGPVYVLDGPTGYPMYKWQGLSGVHAPLEFGGERVYVHSDAGTVYTVKLGW